MRACKAPSRNRSTKGAQRKLTAYGVAAAPIRPMEVRERPSSRSQMESVANTSEDGSPLAMPKRKIVRKRGSRSRAVHALCEGSAMIGF